MAAKKKGSMRRLLVWLGLAVFILCLALAVTFTYYRLRGPTEEQRAALALMHKDWRPAQGVNAFPLLFYMGYDVPEDRREAQMAADIEKARQPDAMDAYFNRHHTDAPLLPEFSETEKAVMCDVWDQNDCLTRIAAHPDAVRAVLAAHSVLAGRAQALERADFNWRITETFPPLDGDAQRLWLNAFALKYVEGDRIGALAATCRNLAAWRRMARGVNWVEGAMWADSNMVGAIRLYAQMLAGLPQDTAAPEDCALALQPVAAADVDRCAQFAGRFADEELMFRGIEESFLDASVSWYERLLRDALIDTRQFLAWDAQYLATDCKGDTIARLLTDELPRREKTGSFLFGAVPVPPGVQGPQCIANLGGCFNAECMTSMCGCALLCKSPPLEDYDAGLLDRAAHLRLTATLLWLREQPGGSVAERFARRPAQLRSPNHASGYDAQRGVLYVANLLGGFSEASTPEKRFELPVGRPR